MDRMLRTLLLPVPKDPRGITKALLAAKSAAEAALAQLPDLWFIHFQMADDEWSREQEIAQKLNAGIAGVADGVARSDKEIVEGGPSAPTTQERARRLCLALSEVVVAALGDRYLMIEAPGAFLRLVHEEERP